MNWHLLSISEVAECLKTSPNGLDSKIAQQLLIEIGHNKIIDTRKKSALKMFLSQFADLMVLILIIAAIISGLVGDVVDTIVIVLIVFVNSIIGFIQEYRAEKTMEALKTMSATSARIIRNSKVEDINAIELVPGDVVMLEAGNVIPADIRFIEAYQIRVDESSLTGESINIEKSIDKLPHGEYVLGDRVNMGFKGTFITNGRAIGYVVSTGMNTELGRIAKMIQTDEVQTPLQKRLTVFGRKLTSVILLICAIVFFLGWWRGEKVLEVLLTSISLAVAAIPEALPALITIVLAIGAKRLVLNNALVRNLPAVETLGSVTYICSDKTGTLTLNQMTVQEVIVFSNVNNTPLLGENSHLLTAIALNNDVVKTENGAFMGDSTEIALAQYALSLHKDRFELEQLYPRIAEIPFDSTRKCMTTIHQTDRGQFAITKGAVDVLLNKLSPVFHKHIPEYESVLNEMANKGYRILGYAMKPLSSEQSIYSSSNVECDLQLIGLVGLMDPARKEAKQAVLECKKANIIPVMITGDHPLTAAAIAKELGILSSDSDKVLTGSELSLLSDRQFNEIVQYVKVYARVNPEQKLKIVKTLQSRNQIVAMTGDGVNDAPALKNADIGIAMGKNGTEVAKEASNMILMDDNFASIVVAVKHGRIVFDNILKFVKYIMTGNTGEILVILMAPLFNLPIPLLAIHILWINLVTDGLPGLALAFEPAEVDVMKRAPRKVDASIFSGGVAVHILWVGILTGLVTLLAQTWALNNGNPHWQTIAFTVLCFSQLGHVLAIRSDLYSVFKIGFFTNKPMLLAVALMVILQLAIIYMPFFNRVFKTNPLSFSDLAISILFSTIVFVSVELEKFIRLNRTQRALKMNK